MKCPVLVVMSLFSSVLACAQTEGARISGRVTDPSDAVIVGAECKITNLETNLATTTTTNKDGIYVISNLRPATYQLTIQKEGFRTVVQPNLQLYVQDAVNQNFTLALGLVSESLHGCGHPPAPNGLGGGQHRGGSAVRSQHAAKWAQLPVPDRVDAGRIVHIAESRTRPIQCERTA